MAMAATPYDKVLAKNIKAARNRKGLDQKSVAKRMKALGFERWVRQTVGSTEKPARQVTGPELLGLAFALETTIPALMAPPRYDSDEVAFPGGSIKFISVEAVATGFNDGAVKWDGDKPVFGPGERSWWGDPPGWGRTVPEVLRQADAEDD
jgi:transcriptional regulator with XRE-family HTH domain